MRDCTDITMILDRSGSMTATRKETVGGVNRFLEEQKKVPGEAVFSLVQFDDFYENWTTGKKLAEVEPMTEESYQPRGWTALIAAIARTIEETGERLRALPEAERPNKVVFVIITDGQENWSEKVSWSKGVTRAALREMVERQREVYKWEFVFLGANQDAFEEARFIGVPVANVANYNADPVGTARAYAAVSVGMSNLRAGVTPSGGYFSGANNVSEDEDDPVGKTSSSGSRVVI